MDRDVFSAIKIFHRFFHGVLEMVLRVVYVKVMGRIMEELL